MSSLQAGDDMAAAVQKTPHRVSLASMETKVAEVDYYRPAHSPHMTIACVKLTNGFVLVGKSTPADPENYDAGLGAKFAYEDALRQMWPFEGYLLCEQLKA